MLKRLVIGSIGVLATTVAAQTPAELELFKAINAAVPAPTPASVNAEAMTLLKTMVERKEAACLPTDIAVGEIRPATASKLAAAGINSKQLKNIWTTFGKLEGCPSAAPARFMVIRMADNSLLVRMVNTGETLTTTSQMRDTSASAAMAAMIAVRNAVPDCKGDDMSMGDTRIATRAPDLGPDFYGARYAGSWSEVWRFKVCGREADVPLDFRADGTGGVYSNIPGAEVSLVKP